MKRLPRPDVRPVTDKSLQELEGTAPGPAPIETHVLTEIHRLYAVPLKQYRIEDLRLMIGQGRGLPYLIPLALAHLEKHPLSGGDLYKGDLLSSVSRVAEDFWKERPAWRAQLIRALEGAVSRARRVKTVGGFDSDIERILAHHRAASGLTSA